MRKSEGRAGSSITPDLWECEVRETHYALPVTPHDS